MDTDNSAMVTNSESNLEAVDFTVTFYYPVENDELVIDLKPYYPNRCCFEVIAIENRETEKAKEVFVSQNRTEVVYELQDYGYWHQTEAFDIVTYVIKDLDTDETAIGKITIQRIEQGAFQAKDVELTFTNEDLNWETDEPLEIPLRFLNKQDGLKLVEVGAYDKKLIKHIAFSPEDESEMLIYVETKCSPWLGGVSTEFDYAVQATIDGEQTVSKAKFKLRAVDAAFYAEMVEIEVSEPIPSSIYIDIREHNRNFAEISLIDVETDTPSERGIVYFDQGGLGVTYVFNTTSGYWDSEDSTDILPYRLRNHVTGQEAVGYILIEKEENDSGDCDNEVPISFRIDAAQAPMPENAAAGNSNFNFILSLPNDVDHWQISLQLVPNDGAFNTEHYNWSAKDIAYLPVNEKDIDDLYNMYLRIVNMNSGCVYCMRASSVELSIGNQISGSLLLGDSCVPFGTSGSSGSNDDCQSSVEMQLEIRDSDDATTLDLFAYFPNNEIWNAHIQLLPTDGGAATEIVTQNDVYRATLLHRSVNDNYDIYVRLENVETGCVYCTSLAAEFVELYVSNNFILFYGDQCIPLSTGSGN